MEAHESSELIEAHHGSSQKNRTALTISILAMVLAIANLGGSNSAKEATQENILAANAYSFYQAKTIRQTSLKIAATDLDLQMKRDSSMPGDVREAFRGKLDEYRKTIDRYESEPENGEGKNCLRAPRNTRKPATMRCARIRGSTTPRACCRSPSCCCRFPSSHR